jgi:hypothetical protein
MLITVEKYPMLYKGLRVRLALSTGATSACDTDTDGEATDRPLRNMICTNRQRLHKCAIIM